VPKNFPRREQLGGFPICSASLASSHELPNDGSRLKEFRGQLSF